MLILSIEFLGHLRPVKKAFDDHTEAAPACLEGTRVELLASITTWMTNPLSEAIYWLSGAAGTGKTTVAQSVADNARALGFVCASFFFSRTADDRRNYGYVLPTLAYQFGMNKRLRSVVCTAVAADIDIQTRSVQLQTQKLLVDVLSPLLSDPPPGLLIVLDALDECNEDGNKTHGGDLIPVLLAAIKSIPFAKIFLTSRPESSIQRMFSRQAIAGDARTLALHRDIDIDTVQADIERYLRSELVKVKENVTSAREFPSDAEIHALVQQANGLFIYARTAVDFICDPDGFPNLQLAALIRPSHGRYSGQYARLDGLYTRVLIGALGITPQNRHFIKNHLRNLLVALVLVRKELSALSLSALSGVEEHECGRFLRRISAVINYEPGTSEPVRLVHASFPDFLSDPARCVELSEYGVDIIEDHFRLVENCLAIMNVALHYNICRIRDPSLFNDEVSDLRARLNQYVPKPLRYACRFWAVHWLEHIRAARSQCRVPIGLESFCATHLLHWIELLSLIDSLDVVQRVMPDLLAIMDVSLRFRHTFITKLMMYTDPSAF
jgi:hypothetical protein